MGRVGFGGVQVGSLLLNCGDLPPPPNLYEAGPEEPVLSIPPPGDWAWFSLRVPTLTFRQGVRRPGAPPVRAAGGSPGEGFGL